MNPEFFNESRIVADLGWTLAHSIWQIAIISLVLFLLIRVLANFSANLRYAVSVSALIFALLLPIITFQQLTTNSAAKSSKLTENETINDFERAGRIAGPAAEPPAQAQSGAYGPMSEDGGFLAGITGLRQFVASYFQTILPLAVALWLLGIALYSFRLLGGFWQLYTYKTREISKPDADLQKRFNDLCEKLRIRQRVELVKSHLVETPIAIGWLKPLIIMPASVLLQIDPRGLEIILAHELIHIRRHDALVNIMQSVIEVLFFYHPGVWWMSAQIRREREFAADAAVLKVFEDSHVVYAKTLADLEEIRRLANKQTPRLAAAANGGNLMQRIQKILQNNTEIRSANSAWSAGLALILIPAVLLSVFSFNSSSFVNAQSRTANRKVAIGFVSIPPLDRTENPPKDADATARLMIEKLRSHKIPAIGFVQGGMISDGDKLYPVRANIVRLWRDAGFEIGIGGFKHISFYDTPYEEYVANVEKNERIARQIMAEKNLPLRYFSYPFLNTGKNSEDKTKFEAWLKDRGLTSVKYTIDNNEWMYSYAYDVARNDNDLNTMKEIRKAFLDYMTEMFAYHEAYSQGIFGRDIAQTMVLTPSRLVADSADELFGMIQKRGYSFVSMDDALADEAYKTDETFAGKAGISWFERWTLAQNKRLRDEPKVDETVQKTWEAKKPTK